jgi:hypothetical protein
MRETLLPTCQLCIELDAESLCQLATTTDVAHNLADVIHKHREQAYRRLFSPFASLYYPFGYPPHSPHTLYYVTHR